MPKVCPEIGIKIIGHKPLKTFFLSHKPWVYTGQAYVSKILYASIVTNLGFLNVGPTMTS